MKRFFFKLALFTMILILLQRVIINYVPYHPPESIRSLETYQKQKTNIIYFGDSTTNYYGLHDADHRSTQTMLESLLKNKTVGALRHDSYHAGMYDAYTQYMVKKQFYPEYVIVPVNLRSFSISWDLGPGSQFTDEVFYLNFYDTPVGPFLTFLVNLAVPESNRLFETVYAMAPEYDGNRIVGTGGDFETKIHNTTTDGRTKAMFEMYYLASLNQNNRRYQSFVNIVKRYKNTKTKLIFYVTPVDYQTGEKYFGKRFVDQIKRNTREIVSRLRQEGAEVLDISLTLPPKDFIWNEQFYVSEHLNQVGRNFVATQLAKAIEAK